jgi:pimeloyl-ACP methyl ester carboxylesterase
MAATRPDISRRGALAMLAATGAVTSAAAGQESSQHQPADLPIERHWAVKWRDGKRIWLAMYRKRLPDRGDTARPVLFLVHGSSIAALASFDLAVPDHGEYSMMNVFARLGYDVWTMDHEGYGESSRTDENSNIASGIEDLKAAAEVLARETGQQQYDLFGESSGAIRAGAYAMAAPERVRSVALAAFTYTGKGSPTLTKRAEQVEYYRTHNRRVRDRAMIESIFTRDKPGTTDPAVPAAIAAKELQYGTTVPTGTYLDMTANLPLVDPKRVSCPVLLVRGEYDGIATPEDIWDFYRQLPNGDRQLATIAGAAHALGTSRNRAAFWHVVHGFLTTPALVQS